MATMRSTLGVPTIGERLPKGAPLHGICSGNSVMFGACKGLQKVQLVEEKAGKPKAPRAAFGPDGQPNMPPSHKIKAASLSAFEEFRNASANRECFFTFLLGYCGLVLLAAPFRELQGHSLSSSARLDHECPGGQPFDKLLF